MESVLCHDNFSSLIFYSASTFSGVSFTSRCSVEISRGALEVNSESVSSENRDDVGVIFLLSLKPFQDRSFLSPVCKSANSRQKVWTARASLVHQGCSQSRAARELYACIGKADWHLWRFTRSVQCRYSQYYFFPMALLETFQLLSLQASLTTANSSRFSAQMSYEYLIEGHELTEIT